MPRRAPSRLSHGPTARIDANSEADISGKGVLVVEATVALNWLNYR